MIATIGGGASFRIQAGETESTDRWELKDEQDRRRGKKQMAVKKVKRLLAEQGKVVPLL